MDHMPQSLPGRVGRVLLVAVTLAPFAGPAPMLPADLRIHVGETYDFLWTPAGPGDYTLRIVTTFDRGAPLFPRDAPPPHTQEIPVRVR
jgi:hypothetical protein